MSKTDELLETLRAKPGMYLGVPTLTGLQHFFTGFDVALAVHNIEVERVGLWREHSRELPSFHAWVTRKLGYGNANWGYSHTILKHTDGDEAAALALFWELLDEYRALEVEVDAASA